MDVRHTVETLRHFIGGLWLDAEGDEIFEDLNPLDDSLYAHAAKGTGGDLRKTIAAAGAAFPAMVFAKLLTGSLHPAPSRGGSAQAGSPLERATARGRPGHGGSGHYVRGFSRWSKDDLARSISARFSMTQDARWASRANRLCPSG